MAEPLRADTGRRARICVSCRTLLDDGESCPGRTHKTVSLRSAEGRRALDDEVWGPDSRARKLRQAAKAGAGGAGAGSIVQGCDLPSLDGCGASDEVLLVLLALAIFTVAAIALVWLVRALVRWIRAKTARPKPHGALRAPPAPASRAVAARGVVRTGTPLATPWRAGSALAYAMELYEARVFGGGAMLRDAESGGFEITLDDGRALRIPPGRVHVVGRLEAVDVDRARIAERLEGLDPHAAPGSRALFPFDHARALAIGPGDRVEVLGEVQASRDDGGGYRSSAAVVVPVGVPVLRVHGAGDPPRLRVAGGGGGGEAADLDTRDGPGADLDDAPLPQPPARRAESASGDVTGDEQVRPRHT